MRGISAPQGAEIPLILLSRFPGPALYTYHHDETKNRLDTISGSDAISFGYDGLGNQTFKTGNTYVFDAANRLINANGIAYGYDAHGRRVGEIRPTGGKYAMYTQDGVMRGEFDGSVHTAHIYLGGQLIASQKSSAPSGQPAVHQLPTYHHADMLGSPVMETDSAPSPGVVHSNLYEPFGKSKRAGGAPIDGLGYTGHISDGPTGLVYMQQRYYDPQIGRFMGVDPIGVDTGSANNFNRYYYAANNPFSFSDPDGREAKEIEPNSCSRVGSISCSGSYTGDQWGFPRPNSDWMSDEQHEATGSLRLRAEEIVFRTPSADGIVDITHDEMLEVYEDARIRIGMRSDSVGGYENMNLLEFLIEVRELGDTRFFGDAGHTRFRVSSPSAGRYGVWLGGDMNYMAIGISFAQARRSLDAAHLAVSVWNNSGAGTQANLRQRLHFTSLGYELWRPR